MTKARSSHDNPGNLKGAIEQYRKIIDTYKSNRPVVAAALVRMAQCYEKLGDMQGREVIEAGGKVLTILWTSNEGVVTVLVAGSEYAGTHWLQALQQAAQPARACLLGAGGTPLAADSPANGEEELVSGLQYSVFAAI